MIMEFADLYDSFGDLELMILNLSESTLETMIILKLMVLRFSGTLKKLIIRVIDGVKSELYEGPEEKKIYLGYNRIAKIFFKACLTAGISTSVMYHMKPLETRLRAVVNGNESVPFVLPYRTRLFFDVEDWPTFWFVFVYQSPMIYIHLFHTVTIGVLFSFVLHVCGKLAVLAFRIRNLKVDPEANSRHTKRVFHDIVDNHLEIIWMAKAIDDTFCMLLLEELVTTTVILCLAAYNVLVNSDMADMTEFLSFLLYGSTMLLIVYGYCVAGEYLITESLNVHNAFYECQWYDMPNSFRKQLTICMATTNQPLYLTGGHFYIFSMAGFTSVVKTSMAYLSMLRTII
nr:olfactory receptor 78 [Gregopimpla kuwanae]